ncbi:hypothetical protein NHX12_028820 [Muraenolepis orangiensis]|uniref:Uncharacterized protein n=1 Tax=Muraenolepis orangiensis TaxID=630683 RepID=A0A9Q0ECI2_9TELE|nr:hypothetical protein NHX12_028820 [Muraenolepis orangiensis]
MVALETTSLASLGSDGMSWRMCLGNLDQEYGSNFSIVRLRPQLERSAAKPFRPWLCVRGSMKRLTTEGQEATPITDTVPTEA